MDDLLGLIEEIEEGEFEKRCSAEELMSVSHFLVCLAKEGMISDDLEEAQALERDSYALLHPEMTLDLFRNSFC